jgi:hypothetical protein
MKEDEVDPSKDLGEGLEVWFDPSEDLGGGLKVLSADGLREKTQTPEMLNILVNILNKGNPHAELEQGVLSSILQHFLDKKLIPSSTIESMIAYDSRENLQNGDVLRPVIKNGVVTLGQHKLNYSV